MPHLSMQHGQLMAGRVVLATVTPADRYQALVRAGCRPSIAAALVIGLVTIRRAV